MKEKRATFFADIVKVDKTTEEPDVRYVHARIADETRDADGHRADYNWLKTALPEWYQWGNLRDMHKHEVVGVGTTLEDVPSERAFDGMFKVIDPLAVRKLDEGLYKGVSFGAKNMPGNPIRLRKDASTGDQWIVSGTIIEVSLVDRPSNPSARLVIAKAVGGTDLQMIEVEEADVIEKVIGATDLEQYRKRFSPAFASQGLSLADGSYVITNLDDLDLAKGLLATGFGNEVAAGLLIERREAELTKKAPDPALAPGARKNRDNQVGDRAHNAEHPPATNSDKDSPAHKSPDASGSAAAFADQAASGDGRHPPTKPKKKDMTKKKDKAAPDTKGKAQELDSRTHGEDTGPAPMTTDTSKAIAVEAARELGELVDMLQKGVDPELIKEITSSYQGDTTYGGRALLARMLQGRLRNLTEAAQGATAADTANVDGRPIVGEGDPLGLGDLERDGNSRVNTPSPTNVKGPIPDGGVAAGSTPGSTPVAAPNGTDSPDSASRTKAPNDPGTKTGSGAPGKGGLGGQSAPMRSVDGVAQAGPVDGRRDDAPTPSPTGASPAGVLVGSAFESPTNVPTPAGDGTKGSELVVIGGKATRVVRKGAKADLKKSVKKSKKKISKLMKAALADSTSAMTPELFKAAIGQITKGVRKGLKGEMAKFATAETVAGIREDVEALGQRAAPGGALVKVTAVEKTHRINEAVENGRPTTTIPVDVVEQMGRLEKMAKSGNRSLAASASQTLGELVAQYAPKV